MNTAVSVEGLKKSYGSHAVLKGISFEVQCGKIFALLGVNGAGKTTALECVEGLKKYDSGKITVSGKTGIQLQSTSLPSFIKPMEAVRLFAEWNKTQPETQTLEALGIPEFGKKYYANISTGQKRRLHLALALTGNPDIIFLDEPTAGLDVEGRIALHAQIRKLNGEGKTVILASHDMAEVETLCHSIAILKEGEIVFTGSVEELTERVGRKHSVRIKTSAGEESFETDNIGESLKAALDAYSKKGIEVLDIRADRGTLEQHFINISKGEEQ